MGPAGRYDAWNQALVDHFFRAERAGHPVYLQSNREALQEVGAGLGIGPSNAADAFAIAVRSQINFQRSQPISWVEARTRPWRLSPRRADEAPPFVALLGLCVLAASQMQRDEQRGIAGHNYYVHINDLLGYPGRGKPPGFDEITGYWEELVTWLNHDNFGQRGICTARPVGRFRYIGWPLSQCLLRTADRQRLPEFFHFARIPPQAELDAHDLVGPLSRWCEQTACLFPDRLRQLVAHGGDDERLQIAEIVAGEARAWTGEIEEAAGRRLAPIILRVDARKHGRIIDLQLVPRRPSDFPSGPFRSRALSVVLEAMEGSAWYEPLTTASINPQQVLDHGLELRQGRFALRWDPQPVIVASSDSDLGGYTSQPQVVLGQRCLVLSRTALSSRVEALLATYASGGWRKVVTAAGLPPGWTAYLDVSIQTPPPVTGDELRPLMPQQQVSVALDGGLKLDHQTWLVGGEPVLRVSQVAAGRITVDVDGVPVHETTGRTTLLELTSLGLSPGGHTVTVLERSRRFQTVRAADYRPPRIAASRPAPLGHVLVRQGTFYVATFPAPTTLEQPDLAPGEVRVIGAAIHARAEDLPENLPLPIMLEGGARRYLLLGPRPGMVFECRDPAAPPYASLRIQREPAPFEVTPPFQPVWLVRVSWGGNFSVRLIGRAHPPEREAWPPGDTALWARLLRKRYRRPPQGAAAALWRLFQQAAGGR